MTNTLKQIAQAFGSTCVIPPVSGDMTLHGANDVFARIHPDLKHVAHPDDRTDRVIVQPFTIEAETTIREAFSSLGELGTMVLSQHQIVEFARRHKYICYNYNMLTFFLFQYEAGLFVADVGRAFDFNSGELQVGMWSLDYEGKLSEPSSNSKLRHRLVVPCLQQ